MPAQPHVSSPPGFAYRPVDPEIVAGGTSTAATSPRSSDAMNSHSSAMPSDWPPVGAETDPLRRARLLQRSWERLLAHGALGPELPPEATAGLRPMIIESWLRSLATGLEPTDMLPPIEADESEVLERWSAKSQRAKPGPPRWCSVAQKSTFASS